MKANQEESAKLAFPRRLRYVIMYSSKDGADAGSIFGQGCAMRFNRVRTRPNTKNAERLERLDQPTLMAVWPSRRLVDGTRTRGRLATLIQSPTIVLPAFG